MGRLRGGVFVVVLLALVLTGCASHNQPARHAASTAQQAGAPGTHSGTVTRTFQAYDPAGNLAVKVSDVATGNCWTTSVAAPVPGAYRCFAGNQILDPCFTPPKTAAPTQIACVANPWSDAVVLTLTSSLPKGTPVDGKRPWALALNNGARCVSSTGTVPAIDGVNLDYHCTNGADAALADTAAATETAQYALPPATALQSVTVTTIWRG